MARSTRADSRRRKAARQKPNQAAALSVDVHEALTLHAAALSGFAALLRHTELGRTPTAPAIQQRVARTESLNALGLIMDALQRELPILRRLNAKLKRASGAPGRPSARRRPTSR
jgi:hypothetical protein